MPMRKRYYPVVVSCGIRHSVFLPVHSISNWYTWKGRFAENRGLFIPRKDRNTEIQTRDILYIRMYTLNEEMSNLINQTLGASQQNLFQNETNLYINGYSVMIPDISKSPSSAGLGGRKNVDQAINAIR